MKIAVIGGGAAGFMAAITAKETNLKATVTIFEKMLKNHRIISSYKVYVS